MTAKIIAILFLAFALSNAESLIGYKCARMSLSGAFDFTNLYAK